MGKKRVKPPKPKAPRKKGSGIKLSRWERSALNENLRRWRDAPLFVRTGIVPLATPEERRAQIEDLWVRTEARDAAHKAKQRAEADEFAARVRALVSTEEFEALTERMRKVSRDILYELGFWRRELVRLGQLPAPPPRPKVRRLPVVQADLFEPLPLPPAEPLADGPDGPDVKEPEPASCCEVCGWSRASQWPNPAHDRTCPQLRAFMLGMWVRCSACTEARKDRGRVAPACEEHLVAVRTCDAEGHVPGPPPKDYLSGDFCQRCGITLSAAHERAA